MSKSKNLASCLSILFYLQLVTKIIKTHYVFIKKSSKSVRLVQRYPEFPFVLVQCCTKLERAMSGCGGQE